MTQNFWSDVKFLMPQLILALSAMGLLLGGVFRKENATELVSLLAQWVLAPILILLYCFMDFGIQSAVSFEGLVITNAFTKFISIILLVSMMIMLNIHRTYMQADDLDRFEYPLLILFSTLGMLIMVSSGSLMTLYLGLEILSLSLYIMVAIRRGKGREGEAAVKYFVLGALSSALILFGSSYIYGFVGSTTFEGIATGLRAASSIPVMLYMGMGMIIAGMGFKIAAAPFHMWAPDVYEGSPMMVTAYIATLPKLTAFSVLMRLLVDPFLPFVEAWQMVLAVIALLSMIVGTYGALYQTNIKRLLAYSSISHMGYALTGIIPGTSSAMDSVLTYTVIYLIMMIATFVCLLNLRRRDQLLLKINELAGLSKSYPLMGACLCILMFSLAGIPPTAGFFGKFSVFRSAIIGGYYPLAIVGVLTSVVSAVYYLRIVKIMYFDDAFGGDAGMAFDQKLESSSKMIIGFGALVSLLLMTFPQVLMDPIEVASRSLFQG